MPMNPLSKEHIQYFKSFKNSKDYFDFKNKYGSAPATTSSFSEALWLCSRMFMSCGYKLMFSNIVLFTDNPQPHRPDEPEFQQAFVRANDLLKTNVNVLLVPTVDEFDMKPFFKEFLCTVTDVESDAFRTLSPEEQRTSMKNRVYQKFYRTMCQRYLNVSLADGLEFACGVYTFTRNTKTPTSVKILAESNDVVVAKRSYMGEVYNEETNEMEFTQKLLPGELFKCTEIGGKEVIFSAEEVTSMKSMVPPGIRVLGFKPLSVLPERCFIKKLAFLYPAEERVKGSAKLFRALWEKCLEKEKYVLCALTYRRKVPPRYVALVPQSQDTHGHDGFRIVFLPMTSTFDAEILVFISQIKSIFPFIKYFQLISITWTLSILIHQKSHQLARN